MNYLTHYSDVCHCWKCRTITSYSGMVIGGGLAVAVGAFMAYLFVSLFTGVGNRLPELMK